jgi:farnesyl diphosphate synthase
MSCFGSPHAAPDIADFSGLLCDAAQLTRAALATLLPALQGPEGRLCEAMRYSALGPGKAFRAALVLASATVCGAKQAHAVRVAAAMEMLHAYSLIHDDLPAMDNSDMRRGQPSAHRAFDEATAILAGDALLTLAFEVLADPSTHPDAGVRIALVAGLAQASGAAGMVGGQMLDLLGEGQALNLPELIRLHAGKTGALIGFCCTAGAVLADRNGAVGAAQRQALAVYGEQLGLLFQITDDLLDAEGDSITLGKPAGADAAAHKSTFVTVLGIAGARAHALRVATTAQKALGGFGPEADGLRAAVGFLLDRKR